MLIFNYASASICTKLFLAEVCVFTVARRFFSPQRTRTFFAGYSSVQVLAPDRLNFDMAAELMDNQV